MRTYQDLLSDYKILSRDSSTANTTLGGVLINRFIRQILVSRDWVFNRSSKDITAVADQQAYDLPYNCWRVRNVVVTVGTLKYFPKEVADREIWTNLNRTTVSSNATSRYFIEEDEIEFYPIFSSTSPVATVYFQKKNKDLSESDYDTGVAIVTTASPTIVTASPTTVAWTSSMEDRHIKFDDDGYWYPIDSVTSPTQLTVKREINQAIDEGEYQISEMIPLSYGYTDIPLYGALANYYQNKEGSIDQAREWERQYKEGLQNLLRRDAKSVGTVLTKSDLAEIEGVIDINRYPEDLE